MSVRPLEMASEKLEKQRKPRSSFGADFAGTLCSLLVSVPLVSWVFFSIAKRIFETGAYCEVLLKGDLYAVALIALLLIIFVFSIQFCYVFFRENLRWGIYFFLLAAICGGVLLLTVSPNLKGKGEGETAHGLIRFVPMAATAHNNSEYWNNNIKTCFCKDEDCEDLVYRKYLLLRLNINAFDFSSYTKLDEANRLKHTAHDLNGTSAKNGDSRSHEVCYSKILGDMGNTTLCYSCYGCEEKILRDDQASLWELGIKLSLMGVILIISNVLLVVVESVARDLV